MGNYYLVSTEDELYHYGRKGMKWGQNIFGKEARTKRKRVRRLKKARVEKAKQKKISEKRRKDFEAGKIDLKDMTVDELLETKLKASLQSDIATLRSNTRAKTTVEKGKKFSDGVVATGVREGVKEGVKNGVSQIAKALLVRAGNKMFGLEGDGGGNNNNGGTNGGKQQNGQQNPGKKNDRDSGGNSGPSLSKIKTKADKKFNTSAFGEFTKTAANEFKKSGASASDVVDAFREPVKIVRDAVSEASSRSSTSSSNSSRTNYNNTWYQNNERSSSTKNSWSSGRSYVSGLLGDGAVTGEIHTTSSRSNSSQSSLPASRDVSSTSQYRLGTQYIAGLLPAPKDDD